MDFFFTHLRKLLTLTIAIVFVTVLTYVPQEHGKYQTVPTVEAALPTIDAANIAQTTVTALKTISLSAKEFVLDGLGWAIAKAVISNIMASTIDWINSGFRGSPAFVQDLDRFLLNVGDQVAGQFLEELGGEFSFICSPFRLNIQIALALQYQNARERQPYQGCLLSETFDNFDAFVQGDFLQGGWNDFFTITANPGQYTEFGALLTAETTFQERLLAAKENETRTLDFGKGFLSSKVCEDVVGPNGQTKPSCKIVTPGDTIANRLNSVLGTSEQTLIEADEINEVIGALVSTLAVKAITGTAGLLGLSPNTEFTYQGFDGGSYTNSVRNESSSSERVSLASAVGDMNEALDVQQDYRDVARSYNAQAQRILSNRLVTQEIRDGAQEVIEATQKVIEKTTIYIPEIQSLISGYQALESEYNNPDTTAVRKTEITSLQRNIILKVVQGNYYSRAQIETSKLVWQAALDPDGN